MELFRNGMGGLVRTGADFFRLASRLEDVTSAPLHRIAEATCLYVGVDDDGEVSKGLTKVLIGESGLCGNKAESGLGQETSEDRGGANEALEMPRKRLDQPNTPPLIPHSSQKQSPSEFLSSCIRRIKQLIFNPQFILIFRSIFISIATKSNHGSQSCAFWWRKHWAGLRSGEASPCWL